MIHVRSEANLLTADAWRENIEFVAKTLRAAHPDPFAFADEALFDRRIDALIANLGSLEDHEVLIELMKIVASIKDGHSALRGGFSFLSGQYPLRFYAFSDGLFVTGADDANQHLVGAKLISVGGVPAQEALDRVFTITPHDNEMTQLARSPAFLAIPEVLAGLGLARSVRTATYVFRQDRGSEQEVNVEPVSFDETIHWSKDANPSRRPLYLQRRGSNYWSEYLDSERILYVQMNRIRNDVDRSIAEFAAGLEEAENRHTPRCIVLDIRNNGGGNGYLNAPIVQWAAGSPRSRHGRFFVAIGRGTFSAAQKLATALEQESDSIFIGEPTGSRPNHFGDSESFPLPHGDLTLSVSAIFWEDAGATDSRSALEPDVQVATTSTAFFAFEDPVLNYVINDCREKAASKH